MFDCGPIPFMVTVVLKMFSDKAPTYPLNVNVQVAVGSSRIPGKKCTPGLDQFYWSFLQASLGSLESPKLQQNPKHPRFQITAIGGTPSRQKNTSMVYSHSPLLHPRVFSREVHPNPVALPRCSIRLFFPRNLGRTPVVDHHHQQQQQRHDRHYPSCHDHRLLSPNLCYRENNWCSARGNHSYDSGGKETKTHKSHKLFKQMWNYIQRFIVDFCLHCSVCHQYSCQVHPTTVVCWRKG